MDLNSLDDINPTNYKERRLLCKSSYILGYYHFNALYRYCPDISYVLLIRNKSW